MGSFSWVAKKLASNRRLKDMPRSKEDFEQYWSQRN